MAKTVLVTGASGYIATHTIDSFLRQGYNVRGTVRSQKSASEVLKTHAKYPGQLTTVIVPDIAEPNAFDEAVKGVDGIVHLASPFITNAVDFEKELFQPAVKGTTSVLESAQKYNPAITRIVITSSFASVLDPAQGNRPGYTYTEADWNPVTPETASANPVVAYLASKTFAEKAAWDFVRDNKPNFDITTLLPPMVYGPVDQHVEDATKLNTSAADIYRLIDGSEKEVPDTSFWAFADVRDLAEAHVRAFERPEAAGQRYLITSSAYSYQNIVDIIREKFPELREKTPKGDTGAPLPPVYRLDTSKAAKELGMTFRTLEETIVDTVSSFTKLRQ
ncbi:unnamed protein product [Clonostachys rosea]|uniref:NAD-dependent epimerase/dehydratase domain-containing protein n=1 Tax=Bionectria ochroleuca TaxID=29856 RepID=A0ABY6U847_BIOOC|nr:unnamed protein product [Clonostachys rosea]